MERYVNKALAGRWCLWIPACAGMTKLRLRGARAGIESVRLFFLFPTLKKRG